MSLTQPRSTTTTSRRKRRPDAETKADISRERVLGAAAQIFNEKGYSGTTMRDVGRAVGLQAASLYYHYRSKDELIEAVLDKGVDDVAASVRAAVKAVPDAASHKERIAIALDAHLRSVLGSPFSMSARRVFGQVPEPIRKRHLKHRDAYGQFWMTLLRDAAKEGALRSDVDVRLARIFIISALNSALDWYKPEGKSVDQLAKQFNLFITDGLFCSAQRG